MMIALTIICVCSVLVSCVFMLALGVFVGAKCGVFKKPVTEELTQAEQAAKKRAERQLKNFWDYTGDSQKNSEGT